MKRTKENKTVNVSLFSNNNITVNFNSESKTGSTVVYAIAFVLVAKLLAMPISDFNTLIQIISSLLSALGC